MLALIGAAVGVYRVKYESTLQAERIAKLRGEIRKEKEAIALLRAEWSQLSRPDRIQELASRHLALKSFELDRLDKLDKLPEKPKPPGDPIGDMIEEMDPLDITSSIPGAVQ
ncbi:putative secreted (periplasmic) protein [Blastochloris viridis]|uniref:Putative secreted (Periplasmic) protein n=1 Tax=Blastochloris viridis TaxID=1079 RepID=A0A0S4Q6D3_BLAVI|nr:putative secreted (periplasmic) protein [Blastochloris viridis]